LTGLTRHDSTALSRASLAIQEGDLSFGDAALANLFTHLQGFEIKGGATDGGRQEK
jgi:hypothetical protein